jgi:hypothetical protein
MKPITTLLLLILFLVPSCKPTDEKPEGLITINVIPALNNYREFRLSELVESIEYVKLETRPECLVSSAWKVVGEKYIVLLNNQPRQIYLFDRSGKFIRPIGSQGKGPGEYSYPHGIDLSPEEDRILIHDEMGFKIMEFSVDGRLLSSRKIPFGLQEGPFYVDSTTIVYLQGPLMDTVHYPRIVTTGISSGPQNALLYFDFKRYPSNNAGYCLGNDFSHSDQGIIFKDALSDTIYQVSTGLRLKPLIYLNAFATKASYYCMTEPELDALSTVSPDLITSNYVLLIGNDKNERFHLIHNLLTHETFRLPKISDCKLSSGYDYGIINDLDGTDPVWFFGNGDIRNQAVSQVMQIVSLKELIQTDCFIKAELKTTKYRDQLRKLVEESSENDNPVIRILHLN